MSASDAGLAAVSSLDDPVRARLYEIVTGQSAPIGRDEAATAAGIGRPLAAYHLDKMVELGLLSASYQRGAGRTGPGAGRPAKLYSRSGREFAVTVPPREYEVAARLLAAAVEADPTGHSQAGLVSAARQYGNAIGTRAQNSTAGGDADLGVQAALREHGFEPFRAAGGAVQLRNCPFHQLAERHPGMVCGMNLALIAGLIEGIGATGLRAELDPQPSRCCVVILADRPSGDAASAATAPGEA
jgi:predicted ArsR family transcriptional regulator